MTVIINTISELFLIAMFLLYHYVVFSFIDTLLEKPKLKKWYRIPLALFNLALVFLIDLFNYHSSLLYTFIFLIIFIEFSIFYQDKARRVFFIASSCFLHIMVIRGICISLFSVATGFPIYFIANDLFFFTLTAGITFGSLNIILFGVVKLIPGEKIKIINQHDEQLKFLTNWLFLFNLYLLINARIYHQTIDTLFLNEIQLTTLSVILIAFYLVLFFTIEVGKLLGYKEKNTELQESIYKEQQYRNSMMHDSIANYEFNLTQDKIVNGFEDFIKKSGETSTSYNKLLNLMAKKIIHPEDLSDFIAYGQNSNIINEFNCGKSETSIDYRRLSPNGQYFWVKAITNLIKDKNSGDIKGFTYIKNINDIKIKELELKRKAERDFLTELYNKGMTEALISDYLINSVDTDSAGVLYIIDIDNFKEINDHMGHGFGDTLLHDLSSRLKKIFRTDDIVGRIGGDEFIAFLKNTNNSDLAHSKAEEICKAFKNTYCAHDKSEHSVSASIGISLFPNNGSNFEELYKNADIALYVSKNKGKDTHTFYKDDAIFTAYKHNRRKINPIESLSPREL